jgi:hypothetical protein
MSEKLIIIRQSSHLRQISEQEVVKALDETAQRIDREHVHVEMAEYKDAIDQGDWAGQESYIQSKAAEVAAKAAAVSDPRLHFFGLAEIPHVVALGAHIGDERVVHLHEHNRETGTWNWPADTQTLKLARYGLPEGKPIPARGSVVMRVAISVAIADSDVHEAVGDEHLADITVGTAAGIVPTFGNVRSAADLEAVRLEFRKALAALREARPNIDTIHLFVGAGNSTSFAIGQELKLRNSPPVQTYRYRKAAGEPAYKPAILLGLEPSTEEIPLTPEQVARAAEIRTEVFAEQLDKIVAYAAKKKEDFTADRPWYFDLAAKDYLRHVKPFPALRPLAVIFSEMSLAKDKVDPTPYVGSDGYGYDKDRHLWRLSDNLLLAFERAADGNQERLRQIIRLFLFHEYLHDYHSLSKYTAEEVGKFNNCLEHIDYTADTYALLHQLDFSSQNIRDLATSDDAKKNFLADQIELAIRSFWAFDVDGTIEWQVRRIRRYLNWYWRHVQMLRAKDLRTGLVLFRRQPRLEVGGLKLMARDRRVWARLSELDRTTHLELGVVTEDDRLVRLQESADASIRGLLDAFRKGSGSHVEIMRFFNSVYDHVNERGDGAALPSKAELSVTYA